MASLLNDVSKTGAGASRQPLAELPLAPFVRAAQQGQELLLADLNAADNIKSNSQSPASASASTSTSSAASHHHRQRTHSNREAHIATASAALPHSPIKPSPLSPHHRSQQRNAVALKAMANSTIAGSSSSSAPGTPPPASGKVKLFEAELRNRTPAPDGADELERSPATVASPRIQHASSPLKIRLRPASSAGLSSASTTGGRSGSGREEPRYSLRRRREREVSPSPSPAPLSPSSAPLSASATGGRRHTRALTPLDQIIDTSFEGRQEPPSNARPHKDAKFGLKEGANATAAGLVLALAGTVETTPPRLVVEQEEVGLETAGSPTARLEKRRLAAEQEEKEVPALGVPEAFDDGIAPPLTPVLGTLSKPDGEMTAFAAPDAALAALARKKDRVSESEVVQAHREAACSPSPYKRSGAKARGVDADANAVGSPSIDRQDQSASPLAPTPVLPCSVASPSPLGKGKEKEKEKEKERRGPRMMAWDGNVLEDTEADLEKALSGAYALEAFTARRERREARAESMAAASKQATSPHHGLGLDHLGATAGVDVKTTTASETPASAVETAKVSLDDMARKMETHKLTARRMMTRTKAATTTTTAATTTSTTPRTTTRSSRAESEARKRKTPAEPPAAVHAFGTVLEEGPDGDDELGAPAGPTPTSVASTLADTRPAKVRRSK
ncbi:hypothetical protein V8E36_000174 [Tilletia maclaganii]